MVLNTNSLFNNSHLLTSNEFAMLSNTEKLTGFWKCFIMMNFPLCFNFNSTKMMMMMKDFQNCIENHNKDWEYFGYFNGSIYLLSTVSYTSEELKDFFYKAYDFNKFKDFLSEPLPNNNLVNYMFWFNKFTYFDVDVMPFKSVDQLFSEDGFYNHGKFFYKKTLDSFMY